MGGSAAGGEEPFSTARKRFCIGGAVDARRYVYVPRPADDAYRDLVLAGQDVHVLGSRQSGKTSLVFRAASGLANEGWRVAAIDLGALMTATTSLEEWSDRFGRELFHCLDRANARTVIDRGGAANFASAIDSALDLDPRPLLLILDEFDALGMNPDLADAVVRELRAVQQARVVTSGLRRLQLTVMGVRPPERLASSDGLHHRRELLGERIQLDGFEFGDETLRAMSRGFGDRMRHSTELARNALEYSGGYPIACMWLCHLIVEAALEYEPGFRDALERHVQGVLRTERPAFLQVVENYLLAGPHEFAALERYMAVLGERDVVADAADPADSLLVWSGIARRDKDGYLRARCDLTRRYFDLQWAARVRTNAASRRSYTSSGSHTRSDKMVCVLTTSGRIGMRERSGVVVPPDAPHGLGLESLGDVARFEVRPMFSVDSVNIGPHHWELLAREIYRLRMERDPDRDAPKYDGFVVTHGTDTMAYTAAAVGFALGGRLDFPVVFTGAQTTFDVPHGDAESNLLRAALVATADLPEVVVCFGERILRGCRAVKRDDRRFDAFESPSFPELGYVAEEVVLNRQYLRQPEGTHLRPNPKARFSDGILSLMAAPGVRVDLLAQVLDHVDVTGRRTCRGIVLATLGAGSVPDSDEKYSLIPLIERATRLNIPVVLGSAYPIPPENIMRYRPSRSAIEAGAVSAGEMTFPAAAVKLSWVVADVDEQIQNGYIDPDRRCSEVYARLVQDEIGEGADGGIWRDDYGV